jgi:hypothetical protein
MPELPIPDDAAERFRDWVRDFDRAEGVLHDFAYDGDGTREAIFVACADYLTVAQRGRDEIVPEAVDLAERLPRLEDDAERSELGTDDPRVAFPMIAAYLVGGLEEAVHYGFEWSRLCADGQLSLGDAILIGGNADRAREVLQLIRQRNWDWTHYPFK